MTWALAALAGETQSDQLVSALISWGPAGIVLGLILFGRLAPSHHLEELRAEREEYKRLLAAEQAAHGETRAALADQIRRVDAAVEAAKVTQQLLDGLDHPRKTP